MPFRIAVCIFGAFILLAPAPLGAAPAARIESAAPACVDPTVKSQIENIIAACTAIIERGRAAADELASAYRRRAIARATSDFAAAIADFDSALARSTERARVLTDRGRIFVLFGKYAEATADFQAALRFDESHGRAHAGLAWVYGSNGDIEGAYREYSRAFELNPKDWHALVARGITAFELGRPVAALDDLDRALAADRRELEAIGTATTMISGIDFPAEIQVKRARVLEGLGRFDEAVEIHRALLDRYPGYFFASIELSRVLLSAKNDPKGALEALTEAAARNPDEWRIKMQVARFHASRKDGSASRAALAAIALPDRKLDHVQFHHLRSKVWRELEDFDAAVSDIWQAAELNPRYLASVAIDMRERGYLLDLQRVSPREQLLNGLEACVRDFSCAFWD